jgi:hypothetical protein
MKLRHTLTALVLALTLAASSAQAGKFLGIHSADGDDPGGVYEIDADTGDATKIYDVHDDLIGQQWSGNGLALDALNRRVYYTSFPGKLYVYDVAARTNTFLGDLGHNIASGAVYQGDYYYFVQGTGELRKVTFDTNGEIDRELKLATYSDRPWNYGDIAIRSDGMLFASADYGSTSEFFSVDLNAFDTEGTGTVDSISTEVEAKYQLAFSGGTLYGVDTGSDGIFSINLDNGDTTKLSTLTDKGLVINDAAPILMPVPAAAWPTVAILTGIVIWKRRKAASTRD